VCCLVVVGDWALDAVDRIVRDGVALAEIIEQGRQRRELAADAGRGELAGLEMLAPGDHMSTRDGPELRRMVQPGEIGKLPNIVFISASGFGIGDVGEPFALGEAHRRGRRTGPA
jgi:hypothetical protein